MLPFGHYLVHLGTKPNFIYFRWPSWILSAILSFSTGYNGVQFEKNSLPYVKQITLFNENFHKINQQSAPIPLAILEFGGHFELPKCVKLAFFRF